MSYSDALISKTLELFNVVPTAPKSFDEIECDAENFIQDHGVFITKSANHHKGAIKSYYAAKTVDLNSTFHKSWNKIATASSLQLLVEQLLHYMTTYPVDPTYDGAIYIPNEVLEVPEIENSKKTPLLLILGLPQDEIVQKCLALFASGIALKQETIVDILFVLDGLNYKFTGYEDIKNKEAMMYVVDITKVLPVNSELFRYFYFKATGNTLIVKNQENLDAIKASGYAIPELNKEQEILLSKSFNRYKPLWLFFRKANPRNISVVNKISKLSKTHHQPMPPNVLTSLTSNSTFTADEIKKSCEKANLFQIIRALNAVRLYDTEEKARFYRIRNGKGWAKECSSVASKDVAFLDMYQETLSEFLASKLGHLSGKKVFYPESIDYALPVSEKQFSDNITKGTKITLKTNDPENESLLVGIHWKKNVDFDLSSMDIEGGKVGWNAELRNDARTLMHSGDITSVSDSTVGATEFLYCSSSLDKNVLVLNNLYSGRGSDDKVPFDIVLGYGPKTLTCNHMIDPNKVIFRVKGDHTSRQMVLGFIKAAEEPKEGETEQSLEFYLIDQGFGNSSVSGGSPHHKIIQSYILENSQSVILLKELLELAKVEFTEVKEEADIDLSVEALAKDTIINLFA